MKFNAIEEQAAQGDAVWTETEMNELWNEMNVSERSQATTEGSMNEINETEINELIEVKLMKWMRQYLLHRSLRSLARMNWN